MTPLWERAIRLQGQPLRTVDGKAFTFRVASPRTIKVTTQDGGVHDVSRIQFDRVDDKVHLITAGVMPQQLVDDASVKKGQSYIAGIIRELVRRGW